MRAHVIRVESIQASALEAWLAEVSDPAPLRVYLVVDGDEGYGVWEFADGSTVTGRTVSAEHIREHASLMEAYDAARHGDKETP